MTLTSIDICSEIAVEQVISELGKEEWETAAEALADLGAAVVPALLEVIIRGPDRPARELARRARAVIPKIGAAAIEPLIRALQDDRERVRANAATMLGSIPDPRSVGPLIQMLADPSRMAHRSASHALRGLGPHATPALLEAMRSPDAWTRAGAASALWGNKDASTLEPLLTALEDPAPEVRSAAAGAFYGRHDPRSLEPLIRCLSDTDGSVRCLAAESLGSLGDPRAVPPLIAQLGSSMIEARSGAIRALGHLRDRRAVSPIIPILLSAEDHLRADAAMALARIGDPRAIEPIIAAFQGPDDGEWRVRDIIARALASFKDRRVIPHLLAGLQDSDKWVRHSCVEMLGRVGGARMIEWLTPMLNDPDHRVRKVTQFVLSREKARMADGERGEAD